MNEAQHAIEAVESEQAAAEASAPAEEAAQAPAASPRLVNVAEAIRYRKRAQAAEQELSELRTRLDETQRQSQAVQQRLEQAEQRAAIDAHLLEANVADIQAARLLVESALGEARDADVSAAVESVRRQRPQLFRAAAPSAAAAMGPAVHAADHGSRSLQRAANVARRSGHNADVMHYMNLRRSAPR